MVREVEVESLCRSSTSSSNNQTGQTNFDLHSLAII